MNSAGRFAAGLALKGVLRRFTGRAEPAAVAARKRPKRQRGKRRRAPSDRLLVRLRTSNRVVAPRFT
jgi:hypothetical protein